MQEILTAAASTVAKDSKLIKEVYEDTLQPTAKNVGQALGTLSSTLNMLLAPISWAVYGFEQIDNVVKDKLKDKLSNTPIENLKEPEPNIVIPAYEALRYSLNKEQLREMYINLIANSMQNNTSDKVHPAFVEVIRQLSVFDAELLKKLSDTKETQFGIVKTRLIKSQNDDTGLEWIKHIINPIFGMNALNSTKYAISLENLERLKLIKIVYDSSLIDDSEYIAIENNDICSYCKERSPHLHDIYKTLKIKRGILSLTDFGKEFISICIM